MNNTTSNRDNSVESKKTMPMTGISALLVIFAVLCLTVFAILAISTVEADRKLADKSLKQVQNYYAADAMAEEVLSSLRQGEIPEGVSRIGLTEEGWTTYEYKCPISETQHIAVKVAINGRQYQVIRWQVVSSFQWESDENLNVWDGE